MVECVRKSKENGSCLSDEQSMCVCVWEGGCVLFSISHLVSAGGKRFRFELWVRDVINGQRCFGVLSKAILHRD